jgi:hypothetical protein
MSAQSLPDRPNLDHLKRQAKDLVKSGAAERLRDAQRAIAVRYGFDSWDALRAHVDQVNAVPVQVPRRGLVYDDPIPDVTPIDGPITPALLQRLADQHVTGVKLERGAAAGTLPLLADLTALVRIDLSHRDDIVDTDLEFLAAMPWLTAISLAHCGRISDAAASHFRGQQQLAQVNLQATTTGDHALTVLAGLPNLCRLSVGRLCSDTGVERLRHLSALARPGTLDSFLGISSARTLTDRALESIGRLPGLAALDVHTSAFGSPHYTARGVAHLRQLPALEELNFHGVLATDAVLRELAGIPRLRWLHCQDPISGDDGFEALSRCETLERFAARTARSISDRGFVAMARLPRLSSLSLGGRRLSDQALAAFAAHDTLVELHPIRFGDAAFEFIARIPKLSRLTNMYNRATTDGATRHLRGHSQLSYYGAFGTQITDESLELLTTLPRLESVEISTCNGITDAGLQALVHAPRLRTLSVSDCPNVNGQWAASAPPRLVAKSTMARCTPRVTLPRR